ncbi:MAG: helix-turn-helix domain-containing protein [Candidatus Thalassarchaeaceae archaeon]|nr:helix-turn-helix domain-containing protein [Candidatus Thalassarchaeaceae archaeon]MDP6844313.1 helix-turn-helix domain-containing protein [Candidatus Thalassarchaeaceae archaeon]
MLLEGGVITVTEMQHLSVRVRLPEGHWAGDITRNNHHVVLKIEEHMPLPNGRGSAQAILFGKDVENFIQDMAAHVGIEEFSLYNRTDESTHLTVDIGRGGGGFLRPMMNAATVPRTPFEVRDGWVEWEFITDRIHAIALTEQLKDAGIPYKVLSISKNETTRLLTPRQREVFDLAVIGGYYDTPRRITLTKLADEIGISKSTLCEMMHLIEKHIIYEFADDVREQSPQ